MEDKNDWITQGTIISSKHKRRLYAFPNNSNYPHAKVDYIQYFKKLRKVIQHDAKRHYSRLIAKSNNKIKNMENYKKETGKVHSVKHVPLVTYENCKIRGSNKRDQCFQ